MRSNWMLPDASRVLVGVVLISCILFPPGTHAQAVIEWESINNGLQGGAVEEFWQSPSGAFFAGGRSSGLFRSPALLEPWAPTTVTKNHVFGFTADLSGQLYLLTQQGILESKDDGLSWAKSTIPAGMWPLYFTAEGVAYGRNSDGVYRRESPASDWVLTKQWTADEIYGNGDEAIESVRILKLRPDGSLVAGVGSQVFLSSDGVDWECLSFDDSGSCWERYITWGNGETELANITSITLLGDDLLIHAKGRYDNQEARYEAATHRISTPRGVACGANQTFETDQAFFVNANGCCNQGGCGGFGLHRLDKDFDPYEWEEISSNSVGWFHSVYTVAEDESWICEGSGLGVRCTFDGGINWEPWNTGLHNISASTLFFRENGELMVGASYGRVSNLDDPTAQWEPLFINLRGRSGSGEACLLPPSTFVEHSNDSLYAIVGGSVYSASEVSDFWQITPASLDHFEYRSSPLYEQRPAEHTLPACGAASFSFRGEYTCENRRRTRLLSVDSTLYLNSGILYRSDDGFIDHLIEITPSREDREYKTPVIDVLAGSQLLYAMNSTLFVSDDKGASWITHELPDSEATILDISVVKDSVVIVGTTNGLYRSEDVGRTWSGHQLGGGCFNMIESNGKGIVVAGDQYLSRDFGSTWETITTPLPGFVSALAFDSNGVLYTSTVGWGLYRSTAPLYTVADAPGPALAEMPVEVYPNPAVERVYVEVEVESNEEVIIALFDLLGRNMGELDRRMLVRGAHRVDVRLPDISSGLYLLRISTANKTTSRAVTIL